MARDLEAENRRLRQVLAEVRAHARVELALASVHAGAGGLNTLAAIASAVDSVLPAHVATLPVRAPLREVGS